MSDVNSGTEIPGEVEAKAREMGWRPKEEWEGDDSGWMEAPAFVERQEKLTDRADVAAQNEIKRLKGELTTLRSEQAETKQTIEDFKGWQTKAEERIYKKALKDLQAQQRAAVESGDTDAFDSASKEIGELVEETRKPAETRQPPENPAFKDWKRDNTWYEKNYELTAFAEQIGPIIARSERFNPEDPAFYERITEEVRKKYPEAFENPNRKRPGAVEESGGGGKKGDTIADLPREAKEAGERFVKQGLFKDMKEYAKDYFAMEES